MLTGQIDNMTVTFQEAIDGALDTKENRVVQLGATPDVVELADGSKPAIGVIAGKLTPGHPDVAVTLLNKAGTLTVRQSTAIVPGSHVKVASGDAGSVVTATTGDRSIGIKHSGGNGANGEIISIIPIVETV